ncbi:olfactory receptor 51I2 [Camelus ferus]|nr:olfactory receptor 51I2 [Camelus ferus]
MWYLTKIKLVEAVWKICKERKSFINISLFQPPDFLIIGIPINISLFRPPDFLIIGIPGLEAIHGWISIPFSSIYTAALTGNGLILLAVRRTPSLHQPMYYFLSMLALTDVGLTLSTMPTTLAVLWFDHRLIGFNACLVQMFFLHFFSVVESSVLLAMSFDRFVAISNPLRYAAVLTNSVIIAGPHRLLLAMSFDRFVAISNPLRYAAVLTNSVIISIGLAIVAHATLSLFPVPFLIKHLNFCPGNNFLSHSFCFHLDVMRRACADISISIHYGLCVVVSTGGIESLLIVLSYSLILHMVMGLASPREHIWALNNCISHILAVSSLFQLSPCP